MTAVALARVRHEPVAELAHELRVPLTHIKGFVSSLRRSDIEWDVDTRNEFLAEIEMETDRMAQLVESLLTFGACDSTADAGAHLSLTDPAAIVDGALHRIRGSLGARVLRRKIAPDLPSVRMDASQMERVLANLLQNAIKYSPPGTPIGVSARITTSGELEFTIDDEGPGIPVADRERIFEPFFRKHTVRQSDVPGHGLGLAICHSIVLAHAGHIRVTDRRSGGARFSVFVPGPREGTNDPTKHPRRGRRGTNAQTSEQQPQSQRLRRSPGRGWLGSAEADRGAPIRPIAA
jgi:two-component system sensor histidine kinase KdpD